ncbi:MAG TPA: hypothetical protein VHZ50_04660, partial [Puia sp.]|nr:hypothetical protein [Puia sp.]
MKLPILLAEFLYEHKKLSLPGIGNFSINSSVEIPDESGKENAFIPEIEFENATVNEPADELIEYIKKNTGKIKPLAIADLDSYLTLCKQMINIGRPFYMEGIGTLSRGKDARFSFVSGKDDISGTPSAVMEKEHAPEKRQSMFDKDHEFYKLQRNIGKKIALAFAVIVGLAIIGWGGYKLYEKSSSPETNEVAATVPATDSNKIVTDTQQVSKPTVDSSKIKKAEIKPQPQLSLKPRTDSSQYKFVILETNNKYKALRRYNQLLSYLLKIKLQTKDSSFFKL